ncbi:1-acyl-sn-glycerol-3-phosphate acyltransferase [Cymbomonas tetramitiformis]|uniref:1-acylglycerol-3-phosphate O-acyltransferase n=1 Tax=Cymbomonas tetramitiformis TaxID=36881 RepID=A0AAE0BNI2_9CHLO|nr:1-acyl-sn-glycerol-3-phosphate acyltransferase [Cymbomonas tetramitiformis]
MKNELPVSLSAVKSNSLLWGFLSSVLACLSSIIWRFKRVVVAAIVLCHCAASAFFGLIFVVYPAAILIRPFHRPLFYQAARVLFGGYWLSCLMFTEWMNFTAIRLSGEVPKSGENVLLILNHKCNIDSMYIWSAIARVELGAVGLFKAVVKSSIKYLPIYGWGMKTAGFIYISRSWEQDRAHIKRWAQAVVKDSLACWLTIYPEGTRFTESAKKRSDEQMLKQGLQPYRTELLMPRTSCACCAATGLHFQLCLLRRYWATLAAQGTAVDMVQGMTQIIRSLDGYINTLCDMTIAYARKDGQLLSSTELGTQCLGRIFSGDSPVSTVHIHCAVHKVDELPEGDEQVAEWTQDAWQRKDALLYTLARTGSFPGAIHQVALPFQVVALRFFVFMAMSWGGVYLLWTSSIFRWYTVFACLASMLLAIADPPEW